jgi:hypothetical protein
MKKNRKVPNSFVKILISVMVCFVFLAQNPSQINQQAYAAVSFSNSTDSLPMPHRTFFPIIQKPSLVGFFIDSVNGSDSNSGTNQSEPWKTLGRLRNAKIVPGTNIYLKRGSIWTEKLRLNVSGTPSNRITITAYGSGAAPILSNPGVDNGGAIGLFGNYITIDSLHIQDSELGIDIFSNGNIVQNNEINNVGLGVVVEGQYNLITHNYFHDTRAVHNDPGGQDDWGGDGVDIQNAHNEISFNRFINCETQSYDFGKMGGAFEIYNNGDYTSFHHNWSFQTESFVEISGGSPASAQNVNISYNVIINATRFTIIHDILINNFRVENNTIIDLRPHKNNAGEIGIGRYLVFMGTPSTQNYILRNNILYISDYWKVFDNPITHENNLYYFINPDTQLGYPLGPNELLRVDPKFVDLANYDFHLLPSSPAINAGLNLGYPLDFDLNPVPSNNIPDLGAFEYQGS